MASEYLTLGRGKVHFAPYAAGTFNPLGYDFFGNCPAFNLNVSVEELVHMDSTDGFKEEDASDITSRQVAGTIQCDDMEPKNLGRFFLGSHSTVTQGTATGEVENFSAVQQDQRYRIGVSDAAPTGKRNITITSVTDDAGTPVVFDVTDDWTYDSVRGVLHIVPGGAIADDTNLVVTYDVGAATYKQVISGQTEIVGSLWFEARNARGKNADYLLPYAKLRPEGDLALIGDEYVNFGFQIKALKLSNRAVLYRDDVPVIA